eukprot:483830-Rhodomonas_salina.4
MPSTDRVYAATIHIWLRACYAMSGTDLGHSATRYTCLSSSLPSDPPRMTRMEVCYQPTSPYAMSGTDIAYGALSV